MYNFVYIFTNTLVYTASVVDIYLITESYFYYKKN